MPLHDAAPPPNQQQQQHHQQSLANWRNNIPDEPFLKRIGERMSSRFLRGEQPLSPVTDRTEDRISAPSGNGSARQRQPSNPENRLPPLGSSLTPEDSAAFVRNVAEVAAAAATLAVQNSQSSTPTATPRIPPPGGVHGSTPKSHVPRLRTSHDWDADLAEVGVSGVNGGGHDAPNWSRMKSSMILLGATILYAIIAGLFPLL
jgi:Ca2+:H+ antiporter